MKATNKIQLTVIGAGITGLMTGLTLYKEYALTIIDAGPDPRKETHQQGATYSGMDARHVSLAETAPWTYEHRHDLITKSVLEEGWMCIPEGKLNELEQQWIHEFQDHTKDHDGHDAATEAVMQLNADGVKHWEEIRKEYSFISPIANSSDLPMIARSRSDMQDEFQYDSDIYSKTTSYEDAQLPDSLRPFQTHLNELGGYGYYTTYGTAYRAKTLCIKLINFLEQKGVSFLWSTSVSTELLKDETSYTPIESIRKTDAIVWCAGVSHHASQLLSQYGILIQGVAGCWVAIDNPGVYEACKIYGPEPINYINVTPAGKQLLLSGGYGFVGTRGYDEVATFTTPLMDSFIDEVKRWVPDCHITEQAICIRPSTPSGMPAFAVHHTNKGTPIIIAAGHAAGGFTQAPATAQMIDQELHKLNLS